MFVITCPGCMHRLTLPQACIGQRVKCPKCANDFEARPEAELALDTAPQLPAEPPKQAAAPPLDGAYSANGGAASRSSAARARFCTDCGTKLQGSEDYCPGCGVSLDEAVDRHPRHWPNWRALPPIRSSLAVVSAILIPVGVAAFIAALIVDEMSRFRRGPDALDEFLIGGACMIAVGSELAALICGMVWFYQAWRLVACEDEEFSPGLKVGLLFVPGFNLYWMFVVIPGLSAAIQNELRRLAPTRSHNTGWVPGLVACILVLIPYLQPIAVCMLVGWMLLANNGLQRLIRYHDRLREESREDGP